MFICWLARRLTWIGRLTFGRLLGLYCDVYDVGCSRTATYLIDLFSPRSDPFRYGVTLTVYQTVISSCGAVTVD